jgi:hypothetical protein
MNCFQQQLSRTGVAARWRALKQIFRLQTLRPSMRQAAPSKRFIEAMQYLPTFRLSFPSGEVNEYRLNGNEVEFLTSSGTWRMLSCEDLQLHHVLHTEVAR